MTSHRQAILWVVSLSLVSLLPSPTRGLDTRELGISGNVETQTLVRHPQADEFQWIQNRNTLRLRADWDWLDDGKLLGKAKVPWLKEWKTVLLYRGVYDSFYDVAPGDRQHGQERSDDLIGGSVDDLSGARRRDLMFENDLREAYVDLRFRQIPLSLRLGRQQIVWGEADFFRLMDLWNPIDIRWHLQQEQNWDEIRVPLWLMKGVWEFDDVGPLRDAYLEVVYNPGDYRPAIVTDFAPRPWALPFPSPLRSGQVQYDPVTRFTLAPDFDLQGSSVQRGQFHRNPADASEVGTQFHFTAPAGIEMSLNYLYGRGRAVGASSPFAVRIESIDIPALPGFGSTPVGKYQVDIDDPSSVVPVYPLNVTAEVVHPYMHVMGLTAKYFDEALTGTSFRLETAFVFGAPFQTVDPDKLIPVTVNGFDVPGFRLPSAPLGFEKRDQWSGMLGFDRATYIQRLNREAPWVFSGQFFWTYTLGADVDYLRGNAGTSEAPYFGPMGRWTEGPYAGRIERQQNSRVAGNGDDIQRWEHLITLVATSFYDNGRLVPTLATVIDPVNANQQVLWGFDYSLTNSVILTLQQRFFTDYGSDVPSNDPWFAGGRNHRRDETTLKATYQF